MQENIIINPKKSSGLKVLASIIWLAVFLMIIMLAGSLEKKDPNEETLSDLFKNISKNVNQLVMGTNQQGNSKFISTFSKQIVEEENNIIKVADGASPSVVSVVVKTFNFDFSTGPIESQEGIGTGFIVGESGLIVTNSHVVDDPRGEYSVILKDGTTYEVKKVNLDENSDLAIVEIDARGLPVIELGDSENLKVGQTAIAIGNALGRYQNTVTVGVISGIARELRASSGMGSISTYEGAIQTDAALNPGNSGGPLLNSSGQVIGINVATTLGADNISFAIPINDLKPVLESFLEEGRIVRPYLGVSYSLITSDIANMRRMPEGAYISRVLADSPADKAGLERGDIIINFDGNDVSAQSSLAKSISMKKVGDKVKLIIDRDGEEITLEVTLEEAPSDL